MLRWFALCGLTVLAGCGPQHLAEALYPGGQVFAFRSVDGTSVMQYACAAEGPGGASARDRAAAAHRYFDAALIRFSDRLADRLLADVDAGASKAAFAARLERESDAFAAEAGTEMERRFACTYLGDQRAAP